MATIMDLPNELLYMIAKRALYGSTINLRLHPAKDQITVLPRSGRTSVWFRSDHYNIILVCRRFYNMGNPIYISSSIFVNGDVAQRFSLRHILMKIPAEIKPRVTMLSHVVFANRLGQQAAQLRIPADPQVNERRFVELANLKWYSVTSDVLSNRLDPRRIPVTDPSAALELAADTIRDMCVYRVGRDRRTPRNIAVYRKYKFHSIPVTSECIILSMVSCCSSSTSAS